MGMDKDVKEAFEALFLAPLADLAGLLESGEVTGEAAGDLLALVIAGARAKLAAL